ncbi:MAG: extracellular solute-binding protein [Gammaproteobacteria bacterium]
MNQLVSRLIALLTMALLVACGESSDTDSASTVSEPARDINAEVEAYYAANSDFFRFKTPADIPAGLVWEDGSDLPDIGSPNAKKGGTYYGAIADFPRTLRHVGPDSNGAFRNYILDDVAMSLAHRHPEEYEFYPGVASAWAVDEENHTVYIKMDPDARWSDGEPVTADDMLFLFFFNQSSYIVAPWYNNFYTVNYDNITKYDDHTISITTAVPRPDLLSYALEHTPSPRHFYSELGDDFVERYQWRFVPTTGAYVIHDEDVDKGRSITLSRNENWWAKDKKFWRNRYNMDRIYLSVIRDTPKVFESFKRGDIETFNLNLAEYWYEKLPDTDPDVQNGYIHKAVFYNQWPRPTYGLWINTDRPLLENLDVRIGINYATNFDLVIQNFFRGDYERLNTANDGYGRYTNPDVKARPFDINKAQEYFARAGFTRRGPDGVLVNEQGQRLAFTVTTGYESLQDVLTILKEEALKAGLEFRIEVLDQTAAFKKVQEKQHEIGFSAFGSFLEEYPRFWEYLHSDNAYDQAFLADGSVNPERKLKTQTNNLMAVAVPEIDALVEQYDASTNTEEKMRLSHRLQELHFEHASFVPGFKQPFYRTGYWRWIQWPEGFNHRYTDSATGLYVHWIDEEIRTETLAARRAGRGFEPHIEVYDQYRAQ